MAINDWPEGERPREKLRERGAAALTTAELLAIVLRTGTRGKSAVDLGRDLLQEFGSLSSLFSADVDRLLPIKGLATPRRSSCRLSSSSHAVRCKSRSLPA